VALLGFVAVFNIIFSLQKIHHPKHSFIVATKL
jgi:hypothetical protein